MTPMTAFLATLALLTLSCLVIWWAPRRER